MFLQGNGGKKNIQLGAKKRNEKITRIKQKKNVENLHKNNDIDSN